jgi:hypothetical protein
LWIFGLDRIALEELSRDRIGMKKRMARDGVAMQILAADGVAELLRLVRRKKNPLRLNAAEIARLAEVGGKLERYARGEDDEEYGTFEVRIHIDNPPAESAEDLEAAKAAIRTALSSR